MTLTSLFLLLLLSSLHVVTTVARDTTDADSLAGEANSISPKAYLVRYWNKQIANNLPKPPVLFSKASPLSAGSAATFAQLIAKGAISDHLLSFCEEAQLLCFLHSSANVNGAFRTRLGWNPGYGLNATHSPFGYHNNMQHVIGVNTMATSDYKNVKRGMEPGTFFRESMLKSGNVMLMPDIKNELPKRSFLPQSVSSKLPFSTSKLAELKQIFHASENSTMKKIMVDTLGLCESTAIQGGTKSCVASIEDMIDFATLILGHDVMVRSTESAEGSKQEVLIAVVKRIEGSKVSKPVICHQIPFPYMVYYCHSFLNVRVYEADILDPKSNAKINHGVAICHMDTSAWSPTHEAFLELGSGPGQFEVCHWTEEDSIVWTPAK